MLPLFRDAASAFAPVAMALGVIGILYGAILAFGQTDLKRLVAYTSVSHMGFVLHRRLCRERRSRCRGPFCRSCVTVSAPARCSSLSGALQERIHTRDMGRHGRPVGERAAHGRA